jgi:hypothetical protein
VGSIPYRMYDACKKKKRRGVWGLVDKISPAFELRNSGVPAVVRSFQLSNIAWVLNEQAPGTSAGHRVPLAYFDCNFDWPLLTKGVIAGIDNRRCARGTADRVSPASPLPIIAAYLYLPTQGPNTGYLPKATPMWCTDNGQTTQGRQ